MIASRNEQATIALKIFMHDREDKKARILIADDDEQIRDVLHELLSEAYDCTEVGSAEEALDVVGRETFDLVLSDIMMGGITGLEMVPQVLEQSPDTVVIMISGEQNIESAIEALRVGAFDYITKPFDLQHVEAAVKRALEHQELRRSKRYYENFLEEMVKQRTAELDKANQTLRVLIEASPLAIFVLDQNATVLLWNPAAEQTFGWSKDEVLHKPLPIIPESRREEFEKGFADTLQGRPIANYEAYHQKKDGSLVDVNIWTARLLNPDGEMGGVMAIVADITERKQAEEKIHYLAYNDTLTGLPNRVSFEDRLGEALTRGESSQQPLAVMFLSLDRFKKFNDTLGHMVGDQLLRNVSERLSASMRDGDAIARFASDEFAFLLTRAKTADDAAEMAQKFQNILEAPFDVDGQELYVTASIGIGLYPHDAVDAQDLLKNAGAALYRAKQQGGNNFQFYTADMNERALKRLSLENQLRWAIERKEFKVYYQPQVRITTGQIVGMEALVRWQHPEMGLVSPAEFIPLAEDTGLIAPIGEWVLRSACAQTKSWHDCGFNSLRVAVNLSPRQFQQPDLLLMIETTLKETGLRPDSLELEVTESSVMKNTESAIKTLSELKAMGIKISIDDFGSGYSSLGYLKHLPIDVLKIDQSFVRDMTTAPNDAAIVMAIIQLAHSLQLKVTAEGVETEDQLRFLRLLRCDEMQGYLFCRPVAVEAFEQLLVEGRSLGTMKTASVSPVI
ncbi:MAG TPA: EAL domain-containing protein [Pyrinomonadaceae bacterium]|nr:EAL domain-containing protein [Pyrinomonadaceae bacterium]